MAEVNETSAIVLIRKRQAKHTRDSLGRKTTIEYDLLNREIRRMEKDGSVERRFYDGNGRLVRRVRPNQYEAGADDGAAYQYTYDLQGRKEKFDSDFYETKPDWYISEDGNTKIEFNLVGHNNPPEPPHIKLQLKTKTTKKGPNSGWDTARKIFIKE